MVCELELKRRSYGRLKTTIQSWTEMLQLHPISLLLDTFLEHFIELKLCIPYVILKLWKSGVQRFKWCAIWSWNKEVMAVWRRTRKAEREFRSWNHPLAHECHFAVPYAHFTAAKWAAKIPILYKILPPLRKRSPSFKNGMQSSFYVSFFLLAIKWLQNDLQASK